MPRGRACFEAAPPVGGRYVAWQPVDGPTQLPIPEYSESAICATALDGEGGDEVSGPACARRSLHARSLTLVAVLPRSLTLGGVSVGDFEARCRGGQALSGPWRRATR